VSVTAAASSPADSAESQPPPAKRTDQDPPTTAAAQAASQAISEIYQSVATQPDRRARLHAAFTTWHEVAPDLAPKLVTLLAGRLGVTLGAGDLVWTVEELEQAGRLVSALESPEDRLPFLSEIARHLSQADPAAGIAMAENFPVEAEREQFVGEVLEGWTSADPDGAIKWAVQAPSGAVREGRLDRIVQQLVAEKPLAAAHVVATGFESEAARENAARTVVSRWAYVDPAATGQWLGQFPPGKLRDDLVRMLVITWGTHDGTALKNWVARLPQSPLREEVSAALRGDPAS
jgi:hypothetical protein